MGDLTQAQLDWQAQYLAKVSRIRQILGFEQEALKHFNGKKVDKNTVLNSDSGSTPSAYSSTSGGKAGTFVPPNSIQLPSVSTGKIIIPTQDRAMYHRVRDIAAKESNYAGFQAISEDLYHFAHPEQNYFAPDFIPILLLIHQKVSPAIKKDKITISSGSRKEPEDKDYDAHMGGYGVDISLSGNDRYVLADICWGLGLRGIGVAKTFVHVDAGPDPIVGWGYSGVPIYRGPGSARG